MEIQYRGVTEPSGSKQNGSLHCAANIQAPVGCSQNSDRVVSQAPLLQRNHVTQFGQFVNNFTAHSTPLWCCAKPQCFTLCMFKQCHTQIGADHALISQPPAQYLSHPLLSPAGLAGWCNLLAYFGRNFSKWLVCGSVSLLCRPPVCPTAAG